LKNEQKMPDVCRDTMGNMRSGVLLVSSWLEAFAHRCFIFTLPHLERQREIHTESPLYLSISQGISTTLSKSPILFGHFPKGSQHPLMLLKWSLRSFRCIFPSAFMQFGHFLHISLKAAGVSFLLSLKVKNATEKL
jgi:hypothetical protein